MDPSNTIGLKYEDKVIKMDSTTFPGNIYINTLNKKYRNNQ